MLFFLQLRCPESVKARLRDWEGVNLADSTLRNALFSLMRFNKAVIDYWLRTVVFPVETRQFPNKLMASFWDLVPEDTMHPTTGFSCTNDTQLLYPPNVVQADLEELSGTNGRLVNTLLKEENNGYFVLDQGICSDAILELLVKENIRVLLDVGALVIDRDNRGIAELWLHLTKAKHQNYEAVVYFDRNDQLVVWSAGRERDFDSSPYTASLDKCLIYLDEFHTRGTDLRIPSVSRAALTLGTELPKDRLFQAAMRMRLLGAGHTVCFFAAHEVNVQIKRLLPSNQQIGVHEVIEWAVRNSVRSIRDGLAHWANAGLCYIRKKSARETLEKNTLFQSITPKRFQDTRFGELSDSDELTTLQAVYGDLHSQISIHELIGRNASSIFRTRVQNSTVDSAKYIEGLSIQLNSGQTLKRIYEHWIEYANTSSQTSASLCEQQERELEVQQEVQQQRQVERPGRAHPENPELSPAVQEFIRSGRLSAQFPDLPRAFDNTAIAQIVQMGAWNPNIRVSRDFTRVMSYPLSRDQFLRAPHWILSCVGPPTECRQRGRGTVLQQSASHQRV